MLSPFALSFLVTKIDSGRKSKQESPSWHFPPQSEDVDELIVGQNTSPDPNKMPSTRVYVGNLASDCRERDVERFFKGYGRIREIALKNGYGFVEFEDDRDAEDAVHDLDGKQIVGMR